MNKVILAALIVVLIAGTFVERAGAHLRAGRDKIMTERNHEEKLFRLKPVYDPIKRVRYNRGSFRRARPWKYEQGMAKMTT